MAGHILGQENSFLERLFTILAAENQVRTQGSYSHNVSRDPRHHSNVRTRFLSGCVDEEGLQWQGIHDTLSEAFNSGTNCMSEKNEPYRGLPTDFTTDLADNRLEQRYRSAVDYLCSIAHSFGPVQSSVSRPVFVPSSGVTIPDNHYSVDNGYREISGRNGANLPRLMPTVTRYPIPAAAPSSTTLVRVNYQISNGDHYESSFANNGFVENNGQVHEKNLTSPGIRSNHNNKEQEQLILHDQGTGTTRSSDTPSELVPKLNDRVLAIAKSVENEQRLVKEKYGSGILTPFRPSNSVLQKLGQDLPRAMSNTLPEHVYDGPSNYKGDVTAWGNHSANIPDNENCSLWILGLPKDVTYTELLGSIQNIGKVYTCFINPPTASFTTAAAKIVFFTRNQAEKLLSKMRDGKVIIMGRQITNVRWNKIKKGAYHHPKHSRAIQITGPADLMDFEFFEMFFDHRFMYALDWRCTVPCKEPGKVTHEWRFAALRCQAAAAKMSIERELKNIFEVSWAPDPCDVL